MTLLEAILWLLIGAVVVRIVLYILTRGTVSFPDSNEDKDGFHYGEDRD
jgi:hypothetical protein